MRPPLPKSLIGRLSVLVIAALIGAQVVSFWLFSDARGAALRAAQQAEVIARSVAVLGALEASPPGSRGPILAAATARLLRFSVDPGPSVAISTAPERVAQFAQVLESAREVRVARIALAPDGAPREAPPEALEWLRARMVTAGIAPEAWRVSLRLDDGNWLNLRAEFPRPETRLPPVVLGSSLVSLALILGALWLGLRRITEPLRRLALAADRFGLDTPPPENQTPENQTRAPREVQALSEALARMQARLSGMAAERTQMLAALGHDLRSPITALRLRAEMVEDDETRERIGVTLDEMQEMVETTLAYARGISPDQPSEPVDLAALLAELAEELSRSGAAVRIDPVAPAVLALKPLPMRRALRNLIENAQRYGGGAKVALRRGAETVEITIEDDGPGIPEADLERVFTPFTRLESSRSRETGGTGLGLSIARAILRAQGGEVRLSNRASGGLSATVSLPCPDARS